MRVMHFGQIAANNTAGTAVFPFDKYIDEKVGVFQAEFQGAATATIQGRMTADAAYTDIASITSADATKIKTVALMPDMRMFVSSWVAGNVNVYLGV